MKKEVKIPEAIENIANALRDGGFEVYLVGGCVRDILMKKGPKDWDLTTNAAPQQIQEIFSDSVYENDFGTVGVKMRGEKETDVTEIVEITTFRKESGYSDKRHPDKITFADTIEDDLARRDFTMNAIAIAVQSPKSPLRLTQSEARKVESQKIIDPYKGQDDIKNKIVRAVGDPDKRFGEDALRMMRAIRFLCQLDFEIESATRDAIQKNAKSLKHIAKERIRDEFEKIIMSDQAARGMHELYGLGMLAYVAPELQEAIGVEQNLHHIYTVWEHSVRALDYAVKKKYSLAVRLAALLHDVGKPRTKKGEGKYATFYNHEVMGARIVKKMLSELTFPKEVVDSVTHLVRQHQFYYNTGEISEAGVRRFIKRVGIECVDDLLKVREADRIGSGVPKAVPYKLRHLLFMIDKVRHDPISPKMLATNGTDIMRIAALEPSPKIGMIQNALLDEVLDDPQKNTKEYLEKRIKELAKLSEKEIGDIVTRSKEKQSELESQSEQEMKDKHWVK